MKFEYEKPNLEELELVLEGSFLNYATGDPEHPDVTVDPEETGGNGDSSIWD